MSLHFEPILYMVRGYRDGDADLQYHARAPFDLIFSVHLHGDGVAHVFGAMGEMTPGCIKEACQKLALMGIRTVTMDRHGKHRVYSLDGAGNVRVS